MASWQEVESKLLEDIEEKVFDAGTQLPTELDLALRYQAHRHTIRRAVKSLVNKGLLIIRRGRGTFVQDSHLHYRIGSETRFERNVAELDRSPNTRLISDSVEPASQQAAEALKVRVGTPVCRLDLVREIENVPVIVSRHYFLAASFPNIADDVRRLGSITLALERAGAAGIRRNRSTLIARLPVDSEADLLGQSPTAPVFEMVSTKEDGNGKTIDFGIAVLASHRVRLVIDHP